MRAILIRHGETASNRDGRTQGLSDNALTDTGRAQASAVALALRHERLEAVYASPLCRATETAQIIAAPHGLTVRIEEDLRELDAGDLDGLTIEDLRTNHADFLEEWFRAPGALKMPNGESLEEVQARAYACFERITAQHPNGTVVIVSHNFVIMSLLCRLISLDLDSCRQVRQDVAAINVVEVHERGSVLLRLNDTSHLRES